MMAGDCRMMPPAPTEIEELNATPFGSMLLHAIGEVYSSKARVWLGRQGGFETGWGLEGELEAMKQWCARSNSHLSTNPAP